MTDPAIEVLHVGSASRDLTDDDPRGWRLGGGVTYAALTTARLGLRTAALMGADAVAARADEVDLLRAAGVELRIVALSESPVFRNVETPGGRVQACLAAGHRLPPLDLPPAWSAADAWSLVPVAGEIDDAWSSVVPERAFLVLGWQGWLRDLVAGQAVRRLPPRASELLRRADLVGVSRHDLAPGTQPEDLRRWLRADAGLLVTDGQRGGQFLRPGTDGAAWSWRYEAVPADSQVEPTGAGDTFLAALVAAIVRPQIVGRASQGPAATITLVGGASPEVGPAVTFAAAAASLVIERSGVLGVPDLVAVSARSRRAGPAMPEPYIASG
ncbi:MAG TPA: PfkB family carbohydrate kinase [Candidatus Limnocylindrales bacterium]